MIFYDKCNPQIELIHVPCGFWLETKTTERQKKPPPNYNTHHNTCASTRDLNGQLGHNTDLLRVDPRHQLITLESKYINIYVHACEITSNISEHFNRLIGRILKYYSGRQHHQISKLSFNTKINNFER